MMIGQVLTLLPDLPPFYPEALFATAVRWVLLYLSGSLAAERLFSRERSEGIRLV